MNSVCDRIPQFISLYTDGSLMKQFPGLRLNSLFSGKKKKINLGAPITGRHFYDSYNASVYSEGFFNTLGVVVNNIFTA